MSPAARSAARLPVRRTQAERSEDTRRRILDAVITLLGERGDAGLRTTDVALAADAQEFVFCERFLIALDLAIQGRLQSAPDTAVAQLSAATRLPVEAHWLAALVDAGVPEAVADDLLWLALSIVRGLAIRRLWQHDPPRVRRLFVLWRQMVATHLASLDNKAA